MPAFDGQLYVTEESTPGTEVNHTTAGATDCRRFEITAAGPGVIQRPLVTPFLDRKVPIAPPAKFWNISFETEVKIQDDATTPGELAELFKSAGMSENTVTDVDYTWFNDPNSAANDYSVTIDFEESIDGNIYTAAGCRFAFELEGAFDGPLLIRWRGIGKYKAPAAVASLTGGTPSTNTPLAVLNTSAGFNFHSYDMIARRFRCNSGLSPNVRPHMGNPTDFGYAWPCFIGRGATDPVSGEFEIEAVDETAFDAWTRWAGGTAAAGEVKYLSGSRGLEIELNELVFGAPVKVSGQPNVYRLPWTAHGTASTSSLTLRFT